MISVLSELVRVATELLTEKSDLEREVKEAIRKGEPVRFEYTKQDGSKKVREVMPQAVFPVKGRMTMKGYEVSDPAKTSKMFYLDMIGDVDKGAAPSAPVPEEAQKPQVVDLAGDSVESWTDFFGKAQKKGQLVRFKTKDGHTIIGKPLRYYYFSDMAWDGYVIEDESGKSDVYYYVDITTPNGKKVTSLAGEPLVLKGNETLTELSGLLEGAERDNRKVKLTYLSFDEKYGVWEPKSGGYDVLGYPEMVKERVMGRIEPAAKFALSVIPLRFIGERRHVIDANKGIEDEWLKQHPEKAAPEEKTPATWQGKRDRILRHFGRDIENAFRPVAGERGVPKRFEDFVEQWCNEETWEKVYAGIDSKQSVGRMWQIKGGGTRSAAYGRGYGGYGSGYGGHGGYSRKHEREYWRTTTYYLHFMVKPHSSAADPWQRGEVDFSFHIKSSTSWGEE